MTDIKNIIIDGLNINYVDVGQGKPVLILHGWGANKESFAPVINKLCATKRVIAIDFPGFGKSDAPKDVWDVSAYTEFTHKLITDLGVLGTDIICHSFGGRVTIKLAAQHPEAVGKIVFVDAAGIRKKRTVKYYTKVYTYKLCKKATQNSALRGLLKAVGIDAKARVQAAGSEDYKQLSGTMRATFVNVVNEDLRPYLKDIKSSSLMVYGENDTDTPVYFGKIMESEIPDGGLVVLKNAGHYSYLDQFHQFMAIINVFLEEK